MAFKRAGAVSLQTHHFDATGYDVRPFGIDHDQAHLNRYLFPPILAIHRDVDFDV
jgi:hypothetical protein